MQNSKTIIKLCAYILQECHVQKSQITKKLNAIYSIIYVSRYIYLTYIYIIENTIILI